MKKNFLVLCFLFFGGWTQTFLSHINTSSSAELFNLTEILTEAGLIFPPPSISNKNKNPLKNYPQETLITKKTLILKQNLYTLEVPANTKTNLSVPTQNYLTAQPYFSSKGIIYDADNSSPINGTFSFLIGDTPGKIIIRIYNPDSGKLQEETTFYIEIKN